MINVAGPDYVVFNGVFVSNREVVYSLVNGPVPDSVVLNGVTVSNGEGVVVSSGFRVSDQKCPVLVLQLNKQNY